MSPRIPLQGEVKQGDFHGSIGLYYKPQHLREQMTKTFPRMPFAVVFSGVCMINLPLNLKKPLVVSHGPLQDLPVFSAETPRSLLDPRFVRR